MRDVEMGRNEDATTGMKVQWRKVNELNLSLKSQCFATAKEKIKLSRAIIIFFN